MSQGVDIFYMHYKIKKKRVAEQLINKDCKRVGRKHKQITNTYLSGPEVLGFCPAGAKREKYENKIWVYNLDSTRLAWKLMRVVRRFGLDFHFCLAHRQTESEQRYSHTAA